MTFKFSTLLAAAGLTVGAGVAQAQGFEGAYAGSYFALAIDTPTIWLGGVQAGYNFSVGNNVYVGLEADGAKSSGGPYLGSVAARAGYAVSNDVMLYGDLGIGMNSTSITYWQVGAGGEFNMTDQVYLRAGVDRIQPLTGGPANYLGKAGVGYRF